MIRTERSTKILPQALVNMFALWFEDMGFVGCSSHSGRETFIINSAKKISYVVVYLRGVQMLAGHSSLAVTQRFNEGMARRGQGGGVGVENLRSSYFCAKLKGITFNSIFMQCVKSLE